MTQTLAGRVVCSLAVLVCLSPQAHACSVCFGGSDALITKSLNAGVIALVVTIVAVLSSIAYTAVVWARRAKRLAEASH